jgi:hypothetical protein
MVTPAAVKTTLSDEAMVQAVGGSLEARIITPFTGQFYDLPVSALVVQDQNRTSGCLPGETVYYTFEVTDSDGNVLQTLASGSFTSACQAQVVTGTVSRANNVATNMLRLKAWTTGGYKQITTQAMSRHT